VEAGAVTIHTVEMLNHRDGARQFARTIGAPVIKLLANKFFIFFAINFDWPALADPATQFVKEHADELVRHVRLGPPGSRA
jgi:hypothetical protein